jgi:hypothetical protein
MRAIVASACLGFVALGCESGADVVEKMRPAAEAKLDRMRAATKAALEQPVAGAPELPEKLKFLGDTPNAYLVHPEWLVDPPRPPERSILTPTNGFMTVSGLLRGSQSPTGVTEYYRTTFDGFMAVRWLVVVDTAVFAEGVMAGESSFFGGGFAGTLHFVDIEAGKSIGSLPVEASASDTVTAREGDESRHLSSDVWVNTRDAIADTLAPYSADAKPFR